MKKIIDSHHLVGLDYWLSKNKRELEYKNDITAIKNHNIKALICPFPSSENQLYISENEMICAYAKNNANNVIPVFALNTNYDESYRCIEEYFKAFDVCGIVIWPILCDVDLLKLKEDKRFVNLCQEYDFFIYLHVGAGNEKDIKRVEKIGNYTPQDAIEFAREFSYKKIILGHMLRLSIDSLEKASIMDNVVVETSGVSSQKKWYENEQNVFPSYDAGELKNMDSKEILEHCVKKMNLEDKLVFGSSFPYSLWWKYDLKDEIGLIEQLDISEDAKDKILYNNIRKFLKINF